MHHEWASVQAGDVVILHPDVMHMSATNVSGSIRLSCDTRWQPALDPRDPCFTVWHTVDGVEQKEARQTI